MKMRDKEAKAAYDREYRAKNAARITANKRAYVAANREQEQARVTAWVAANKERSREIKSAWKARNPDADLIAGMSEERRLKHAASSLAYQKANPEAVRRNQRLRRAKVSHATPPWADKAAIKAIYKQARATGMHVDHDVPLRGKLVSGLHVHTNLQLLPPTANKVKGNRYAG